MSSHRHRALHARLPASPALTPASIDAASFLDSAPAPIETTEALRRFILVRGMWVSSLHDTHEVACSPLAASFNALGSIRPA